MRKRFLVTVLAISVVLSIGACGNEENMPSIENAETENEQEGSSQFEENTLSFSEFKELQFSFCSGAGAWQTLMYIDEEGNFSGEYHDSDMGDWGEEYPNGTRYQCDFTGKFTKPVKINDYTYSMQIEEINYEKEAGTEEILDEILVCYSEADGLDGAENILIYMPGTPLAELPEEYRSWVGYYDLSTTGDTELPFMGLYNVAQECGFSSYNMIDSVKEMVAYQEELAVSLETSLENDQLTQADYNELSQRLYAGWDYALNDIWDILRKTLRKDEMEVLLDEQREWIAMKEQAVKDAGADVEGGSMQPMVMNLKAVELTKERVYELLELLE